MYTKQKCPGDIQGILFGCEYSWNDFQYSIFRSNSISWLKSTVQIRRFLSADQ